MKFLKKILGRNRYGPIADRKNCLLEWQRIFPGQEEEIETFISIIHEAFLVPNAFKYYVHPSDSIGFYYNMSRNTDSDNLEYTVFIDRLEEEFNFKYKEGKITSDSTFEDAFRQISKPGTGSV